MVEKNMFFDYNILKAFIHFKKLNKAKNKFSNNIYLI